MQAGRLIFFLPLACVAADLTPQQMFDQLREHVAQQLKRTANYTCVQTIDRTYSVAEHAHSCGSNADPQTKPWMRDRLRLDVAVSQGEEIFSWHGGKSFSSKGILDIVRSGPVSSGSFVGYLQNVFFEKGVKIRYIRAPQAADGRLHFEYDVPLEASHQYIARRRGKDRTAFRGTFAADPQTFELTTLQVVVEKPPARSNLCYTNSEVEYQIVDISGAPSRIPGSLVLEMNDGRVYTTSRSRYTQCRAFLGESKLSFDVAEVPQATDSATTKDEVLPAGLMLPVVIRSSINDFNSYTGDPVEGLLDKNVKLPGGHSIPKGAVLSGVIVRLEQRYQPSTHYVISIRFNRITSGGNSFVLEAVPAETSGNEERLKRIYGQMPPREIRRDLRDTLVWNGSHFQMGDHFLGMWKTVDAMDEEKH